MERTRRGVLLAAFILTAVPSRAQDSGRPTIVLEVTDLTGTAASDLARIMAQTESVFENIGVRVAWSDAAGAGKPCDCKGPRFSVRLLSPFLIKELSKKGVKEGVLGSASGPEALAYIFSERVQALAARRKMNENILLGLVIAHEVGHLLLPGKGHARTGIMTEGIDTDPLGLRPRFTPGEARAIRAFLTKAAGTPSRVVDSR